MTRGRNIAVKRPRRLLIVNNLRQLQHIRDLNRLAPIWKYLRPSVTQSFDLHIPSVDLMPIIRGNPFKISRNYL